MNKPKYLLPFIYVYKFVSIVFKAILSLLSWFFYGFFVVLWFFISYVVDLLKYFIYGFSYVSYLAYKFLISKFIHGLILMCYFVYRIFAQIPEKIGSYFKYHKKISRQKELAKEKEMAERRKQLAIKEQLIREKKQAEIEERKSLKEKDEYINTNVKIIKNEKESESLINRIFSFPIKIKNMIINKYRNSSFIKNKQNKLEMSREELLVNFENKDEVKSAQKKVYRYIAKDADGKMISGTFDAYSSVEVHSFLLSEGYEVYSIKTSKLIQLLYGNANGSNSKIKTKDLIFFITQLSTYLKAGIQLVDALKILGKQFTTSRENRIIKSMIYDLTMGENFSTAMEKQGEAFPQILINMIKASELTGELPEALDDMESYFTESEKTRKQMITAMMYPMIVFVISIAAIVFIMTFVVPKFVTIYESMEAEVPTITKVILNISTFLKTNGIWLLIGILAFIFIFIYLYKKVTIFKGGVQWLLMHTPVFGNVIIFNEITMFTKTFSSLLAHNVFITDSMDILNKMTSNEVYKMIILDTISNLAKGEKISLAFKDHWAVPIPAYEMIVTGEKTGQLPEMMAKVSTYYQELHRNAVTRIKTFIEPVLIIFLTVAVGIIVLSIVIPMFSMYSSIQQ